MRALIAIAILGYVSAAAHGSLQWPQQQQNLVMTPTQTEAAADFPFINQGDRPVTITSIRTSCGCTTADLSKHTFAPGEKGVLNARFNVGSRLGVHVKTIRVTTDEPGEPEYHVKLHVDIPEILRVHPRLVHWTKHEPRTPKYVEITAHDPKSAVQIRGVTVGDKMFTAELLKVEEGRKYRVLITPSEAGIGRLTVTTDQPGRYRDIQVYLRVFGDESEDSTPSQDAREVVESDQPSRAKVIWQQR